MVEKFVLNLISFIWIIVLFFFTNDAYIFNKLNHLHNNAIVVKICFLIVVIILEFMLIKLFDYWMSIKGNIGVGIVPIKIYPIYTEQVASYFSFCAVAFSLSFFERTDYFNTIFILIFLFFVFHINNIGYLNPIFYLIGKRVYKIETEKTNCILITTCKNLKGVQELNGLVGIDEYTYYQIKDL